MLTTAPVWDDGSWEALPRLEGDVTADVCVVGLGGSGLTAVQGLYGDVRAVQVVWTDSRGRLPWEAGYANPRGSQPLLGAR